MDGARNRLPLDAGKHDLAEILDYNLMISLWDDARDIIYNLHSRLTNDPRGFKSISIEYIRCTSSGFPPVSRKDMNRMNNIVMLDISNNVKRSTNDGFSICKNIEEESHFIKWNIGRMLSYVPQYGKTYIKYPSTRDSTYRYINIALRS